MSGAADFEEGALRAGAVPRLLVLSSLFPSSAQPFAGTFIRERMFRVARQLPIVVVAPQAWFPGQGLIRQLRPHFRPPAATRETMDGIDVLRPRFLSVPGLFKRADGVSMAVCSYFTVRRLVQQRRINVLDVHFGYPDGRAGVLLGRWLKLPVVITLRGKEERLSRSDVRAPLIKAIRGANFIVTVSEALRALALSLGAEPQRVQVIGNGIDLEKFFPIPRADARAELLIPEKAKVLVSVGTLVRRKGFHRVIECLPRLLAAEPDLLFVIVGGSGAEGDDSAELRAQVRGLGLEEQVRFLGPLPPDRLRVPLSAADCFVLTSSYEGWANVLLEAMACGLPVIATDVGGNSQVVNSDSLGRIVPLDDAKELESSLTLALKRNWDRAQIRAYAESNTWDRRIPQVIAVFERVVAREKAMAMQGTHVTASSHAE